MPTDVDRTLEGYLRMAEALLDAMEAAVRSHGPENVWRFASFGTYARKYNQLVDVIQHTEPIEAPLEVFDLEQLPTTTNSFAMQQNVVFESVRANLQILRAYLTNRVRPKSARVSEISDFLLATLRRAVLNRPEREKDIQDIIEQLLIGRGLEKGLDYDRETGRVKVSSKEVIPDFILNQISTAMEVKILKGSSMLGRVIDEVNADIRAYGQMYDAIIFVIYDAGGLIRDEFEFRRDLEAVEGVKVLVIKH